MCGAGSNYPKFLKSNPMKHSIFKIHFPTSLLLLFNWYNAITKVRCRFHSFNDMLVFIFNKKIYFYN